MMPRRPRWTTVAGLTLLLLTASASAQDTEALPDVDTVMDHLDDLYRADASHASMTMTIVTENFTRTLEMESWSSGDDLSLVVIRAPSREAGTASLRTAEGLWNYAPRADRLMRVPSGMMSEGWMGSHFSNDDLMRESEYDEDYDTTLSWVDEAGGRSLLARSIPHDDAAVVYTRVDFYMTADTWLPLRTEYWDGDELVRTMTFTELRELDGRTVPAVMTLIPADAPEESTRVEYLELDFDADVDADLFTQRGLRRVAQRQ